MFPRNDHVAALGRLQGEEGVNNPAHYCSDIDLQHVVVQNRVDRSIKSNVVCKDNTAVRNGGAVHARGSIIQATATSS